jgi:hypothetical protein
MQPTFLNQFQTIIKEFKPARVIGRGHKVRIFYKLIGDLHKVICYLVVKLTELNGENMDDGVTAFVQ